MNKRRRHKAKRRRLMAKLQLEWNSRFHRTLSLERWKFLRLKLANLL